MNTNYHPPKVEQLRVIKVTLNHGKGVDGDPIRNIECFYDAESNRLLFVVDPLVDREKALAKLEEAT